MRREPAEAAVGVGGQATQAARLQPEVGGVGEQLFEDRDGGLRWDEARDGAADALVDLGKPENLGRLLRQALNRSKICSSDPLCSEHDPAKDRSLHAAACHACSLVAETSCERGNRYLDRSLLVQTLDRGDAAFFAGLLSRIAVMEPGMFGVMEPVSGC